MSIKEKIFGLFLFASLFGLLIYLTVFSFSKKGKEEVKMLTVVGNTLLPEQNYLEFAQLDKNSSYGEVTLNTIKNRFEKHPYLIKAEVKSDGNGNVEINLKEKEIYAVVISPGEPRFITADFQVLPILSSTTFSDLPVISNAKISRDVKEGTFIKDSEMLQAFKIIDAAKTTDLEIAQKMAEINLRNGGDVVLTFAGINSPVIFGRGDEAKKMIYLNIIWDKVKEAKNIFENSEYLDLRFSNEVYVGTKENLGLI